MSERPRMDETRPRTEWRLLLGVAACALLSMIAWRWHQHRVTDGEQRLRLETQVRDLGAQIEETLFGVDRLLKLVPAHERTDSPYLRLLSDASTDIDALDTLDADGRLVASSGSATGGSDLGTQPCLAQARAQPDDELLYTCKPYRNRSGYWSFELFRVLRSPGGSFDGVVAASLDLNNIGAMLPSALYADDMRAFMLHSSGIVIASGRAYEKRTGASLAQSPGNLLTRFRRLGTSSAVIDDVASVTGERRLVAVHTLNLRGLRMSDAPLLTVSRSVDAIYHDWTLTTWLAGGAWLLGTGAGSAGLFRLQRRRYREADEALELRRQRLAELERIELIVGGAGLSLWVWHAPEQRLEVDPRWCAMVGTPAHDLDAAARTWRARIHPDDRLMIRDVALPRITLGNVVEFEYRLRHDDGHWVWLLTRGKVVAHDASGRPLRFAGSHIDITERKRVEQALRASEESLSTTLQSIGDAVIATDAAGRISRMNAAAARLTGWAPIDALGRDSAEIFRIADGTGRSAIASPVRAVLETGEADPPGGDTVLYARDATVRPIAHRAAPIRNAVGAITGVVLVFSDTTESHRVQRALRDSEEQMRLVTDAMPAAIARFDIDTRFLYANLAYGLILGRATTGLIGHTFDQVFGDAAMAAVQPHVERVLAGVRVSFEETFDTPAYGRRRAAVTLVPDFDADGRVRGHFSVTTDITELRRLEEHMRESQKMDSIGTLAGGIAHDFNNVLGAVVGNAEMALAQLAPGHAARANLEQVSRASQRARGLVQQILTFSRHQPLQLVALPLQPLIEETLAILRSTLPASAQLETEVLEGPLYVNADASQMQQVLMNLGTNAWHALGAAPGRIGIGLAEIALTGPDDPRVAGLAAGRYAHLWVRDNGAGMDESTRRRIFEPFFTTKEVGQGTGLGLSVVHGIVRTHLGAVTLDTHPGAGSTFHVYLPATLRPSQAGARDPAEARVMRGRGQHVLYVDDDEVMGLMVEQLLQNAGYRVTGCQDGKHALALLIEDTQAYDVLVTDFNMPGYSGLDLVRELAAVRPDMPVVLSSGYLSDELRAGAQRVGIRYLLRKENTYEELAGLVQLALAARALA